MRKDGRKADELRPVKIVRNFIKHAEGSVLIEVGDTKIICTATVDDKVPPFKKGTGEGWVTAEYAMIPRATQERNQRDINKLRLSGRSQEIQRLIGRALRSVVDFNVLGERQILIDCDVIQADGGTRTASITGSFIALVDACNKLLEDRVIDKFPLSGYVAAVSVGVIDGVEMLDLCYEEDSNVIVDMNVVMTDSGDLVEIQATGEKAPFSRKQMDNLILLAQKGISELLDIQKKVLGEAAKKIGSAENKHQEEATHL